MQQIEVFPTSEASASVLQQIRHLADVAFGAQFSDADWEHALGGWHAVARTGTTISAHAAVVPRRIEIGGRAFLAGYVEAVATAPRSQGRGLGSAAMTELGRILQREFQLGALATGRYAFYQRLGWERWLGPSYSRRNGELVRTADDDDAIMVLRFGVSSETARSDAIVCDARSGDDW